MLHLEFGKVESDSPPGVVSSCSCSCCGCLRLLAAAGRCWPLLAAAGCWLLRSAATAATTLLLLLLLLLQHLVPKYPSAQRPKYLVLGYPCGPVCVQDLKGLVRAPNRESCVCSRTTPIVFKGELYRFESLRGGNWNNTYNCTNENRGEGRSCPSLLRFRKQSGPPAWRTGEVVTSPFGVGYGLACAIVDEQAGRVHAFATKGGHGPEAGREIGTWSSDAITPDAKWQQNIALMLPNNLKSFNTAVGKGIIDGKEGAPPGTQTQHTTPGVLHELVC